MRNKLSLDPEALAVESFATGAGDDGRGTVHANVYRECTAWESCPCPSAFYHCGDYAPTAYSCDFTKIGYSGCESWVSERETCWDCT